MSKKIPKAYKVLVVIFFIFYFFVLMPIAQEQFTGIEKFLFLIIVSLLSSMLAAYYSIYLFQLLNVLSKVKQKTI